MRFAQWVKGTREDLRLSQTECARRARVSQAAWAKYETQPGQPKVETVKKIATALDVPEDVAMAAAFPTEKGEVPPEVIALWRRAERTGKTDQIFKNWRSTVDLAETAFS